MDFNWFKLAASLFNLILVVYAAYLIYEVTKFHWKMSRDKNSAIVKNLENRHIKEGAIVHIKEEGKYTIIKNYKHDRILKLKEYNQESRCSERSNGIKVFSYQSFKRKSILKVIKRNNITFKVQTEDQKLKMNIEFGGEITPEPWWKMGPFKRIWD